MEDKAGGTVFRMKDHQNNPPRILVADDDPAILRLVQTVLEAEGYTAVTARDGKEAYKLLQSEEPIVAAIFDIVMPHIEGKELLKYMRSERRLMRIPVIMMTVGQSARLSSESFAEGAVAVLPKPFTTSQLKTMLRMFVKQSPVGGT